MRRELTAVAAAASLLLAAACGDGKTASGGTPSADPMAAFRACLQKQGVTMPDRTGRPPGRPSGRPTGRPSDRPTGWPSGAPADRPTGRPSARPSRPAAEQKAMEACRSLAPNRARGGAPPAP
ncbi:PT domain-containing protein [Actinomadura rayongensis]|nr:PT domain-containing protein [Actinomadura rayongensis]